jgi:AcrR family transcriptional regulator
MVARVCDTVGIVKPDVSGLTVDGRRSRWDAHRSTRREELLDAAVRAIIRSGADVGLDEIAAGARTSKPVLYRYFADKTDLYRAVTQRVVGTIIATLESVTADRLDARDLIHESVAAYLALLEQSPQLYRFVIRHPYLEDGTIFSAVIAEMLAGELAQPLAQAGLDPTYARPWGDAIVGFINAASLWWLDHPGTMTRDHLADYLSALLWGGAAGVHQYAGRPADPRPAAGIFPRLEQSED